MSILAPRHAAPPRLDAATPARLRAFAERRFARSADAPTRFFDAHADAIARACLAMARRFERGGRLLVVGAGAQASDAAHVAVEFTHPVLVGKRALPALALAAHTTRTLGRAQDIALGIAADDGATVASALEAARENGMLTLALVGPGGSAAAADFVFTVEDDDVMVVQEVHETLYHVLWELVHVFFEHRVAST